MRFTDKVVLVTGAASGIGRSLVARVVSDGGAVVALDRDSDLAEYGDTDRVAALAGDVTDPAVNAEAVALAVSTFGHLDGAALNAGMSMSGDLLDLPIEEFDRTIDVNVRAVLLGIRAAVPALGAGGSIVVTASTSGTAGDPGMWAYNTSKAAVINLVKATALDLGPKGIRINAVAPGPTETGMTERILGHAETYEGLRRRTALQRWARPEEVAAVIAFLLSDDASIVTGALVPADAGITANTGQFLPSERTY